MTCRAMLTTATGVQLTCDEPTGDHNGQHHDPGSDRKWTYLLEEKWL